MINSYIKYINEIDYINQEGINIYLSELSLPNVDIIKESYKKNIKAVKYFLEDHGVDLSYLKLQAKKASILVKQNYKNGAPASKAANDVVFSIGKSTLINVVKKLKKYYVEDDPKASNVVKSIVIFAIVYVVSKFLSFLALSIGVDPLHAYAVSAIIIAPFIEEYGKKIAVDSKYGFLFTSIFSTIEAVLYVCKFLAAGISLPTAIALRSIGVVLHLVTTWIQTKFVIDNDKVSDTGYFIAVGVHALFNFLVITFNKEILQFFF